MMEVGKESMVVSGNTGQRPENISTTNSVARTRSTGINKSHSYEKGMFEKNVQQIYSTKINLIIRKSKLKKLLCITVTV